MKNYIYDHQRLRTFSENPHSLCVLTINWMRLELIFNGAQQLPGILKACFLYFYLPLSLSVKEISCNMHSNNMQNCSNILFEITTVSHALLPTKDRRTIEEILTDFCKTVSHMMC